VELGVGVFHERIERSEESMVPWYDVTSPASWSAAGGRLADVSTVRKMPGSRHTREVSGADAPITRRYHRD
jgi:hypothetical protein